MKASPPTPVIMFGHVEDCGHGDRGIDRVAAALQDPMPTCDARAGSSPPSPARAHHRASREDAAEPVSHLLVIRLHSTRSG
jgi:hypothetical protein